MPLSRDLDEKIRNRFDTLITEGKQLIAEAPGLSDVGDYAAFEALVVKTQTIAKAVLGDSARGRDIQEKIRTVSKRYGSVTSAERMVGIATGLKDDYESGMLDSVEERVVANVTSDFMAQVDEILVSHRSEDFDHIFAAVMCGAVLEDSLRRLCERQTPRIATIKNNGKPKAMGDLIIDLKKADAFNGLKANQLRAWANVRNLAAHGKFAEFGRVDVEDMVRGVRNFLADYM